MALIQFLFFCVLLRSLSAAQVNPIREHPQTVTVQEGTWANFTCTIKGSGNLLWRIGEYTSRGSSPFSSDNLDELEGVTAKSYRCTCTGKKCTETIGILASAELNGTPVECMLSHYTEPAKNSYSQFALLHVSQGDTSSGSAW